MSADAVAALHRWLADEWSPDLAPREALERLVDAGLAAPSWPAASFGLGTDIDGSRSILRELAARGIAGGGQDLHNLAANTLLAFGRDELKRDLLRPLLLHDVTTCLLYSEPGAGSDLASVQTRADPDVDEWVVNGQKVWTSGAATADIGMLVARTDWDVPKHAGISFFFLPMKQAGVEVRPIRQITGEAHFNEVFMTDARVPASHLVGPVNDGWRVLQTALAYERSVMGDTARGARRTASDGSGAADLIELARATGRSGDPVARQRIARQHALRIVNRWNARRAKAQIAQGEPSPIMSLGKLAMSRILHEGASVRGALLGPEAMLVGDAHAAADDANFLALNAYFTSIGGGTDQIQRNIIGERVLGLPKEPDVDRDMPFRDVRTSSIRR